ncbi:uncharacterized protein LOC133302210 isoform X3 [Gastrolobium bilobum]|uniref:uncharacterized protein LOC133302210 isoform X3 n=1 Tax=Gastrolobium bilobum TaxID=150636 RepID=UPI002AAF175C|nr:uncharacterized protein LOC133302210 isoform X3 [Gastrolobium bilobum]
MDDDEPSESSSKLPWIWVIEALAGFSEITTSTLQGLIDASPIEQDDFCENTKELVAMRCLEELCVNRDASSTLDSRVGFDFSRSCVDVLQEILHEIPLSNLKMAGAELLRWDVSSFIMHKRSGTIKCHLEQLKESILEGTQPHTDYLKERSGLFLQNMGHTGHDNGKSTFAENIETNENLVSLVLDNRDKSSKEHLLDNNFLPFKRNRVYSADKHETDLQLEDPNGSQQTVASDKAQDDTGNSWVEVTADKIVYQGENINVLMKKYEEQNLGMKCKEVGQLLFSDATPVSLVVPESCVGMATTIMPQHTSGAEPCQNKSMDESNDNAHHVYPIPSNGDNADKIQHMINESQPKQNEPNVVPLNFSQSQKPVASDKTVVATFNGCEAELSSDSDRYHNEKIDLAAKKHEFLSSQCTYVQGFSAMTESTEQNLCMKCNERGQLLVCKTTTCPMMVHKNCLGVSAQLDGKGNFVCPFCVYSDTISEYLEAKEKASLARKELAIFISKGIRNQAVHEFHRQEHSPSRKNSMFIHVNNIGNDELTGCEDNREYHVGGHANEVSNLQFERSQPQAPISCVPSSCREKENVNNGLIEALREEERSEMQNAKSLTGGRVEENQVLTDHVDGCGGDKYSCKKANIVCDSQSNGGEEVPQELTKQHNMDGTVEPVCAHDTGKKEISEDGCEKHIISRYSMRFRKHETQYKPQASPLLRRKKIPWTAEEEELIREGVQKFGSSDQTIPWKKILAFGSHVFEKDDKRRTPVDLKDKWKNMCKAHSKSK